MNTATGRISCWRCGQVLWTPTFEGDSLQAMRHVCPAVRAPFLTLEDEVAATERMIRSAWPAISWWRKVRFTVELPVLRRVARMYDALRRWRAR